MDDIIFAMNDTTLFNALERLTAVTHGFTDTDLNQPYGWRAHGEGVRFALLGTHFELRELAVRLASLRRAQGPPLTMVQRILGQFHEAYRDLQGVLTGFDSADYDKKPTPNDWQMRYVLAHMVNAQRTFYALADYGLQMGRDSSLPEKFPLDAPAKIFGPVEDFRMVMEEQGLAEIMALFDDVHRRTLARFGDVPDEAMDSGGPVWWEGEGYPIHYRLGRMEAHLRQHTIQAVKTRTAVSGPLSESVQLLRLLYNAVAGVEAAVFGAPGLGEAEMTDLAAVMVERAEEVGAVVEEVGKLVTAVKAGDTADVDQILAGNPKLVNATDENGLPVLMVVLYHGQRETAELLREAGAEVHIFEAAALGDLETVLVEGTEWPEDINEFSRDGFTPLQLACYFGHFEVAKWLVEQGADVEAVARNAQKIRPIHAAVASGNVEIVRLLLENGADVNARQETGVTALHSAAHRGNLALVELLVRQGADVALKLDGGKNAAELAREAGHEGLAEWLVAFESKAG